MTRILVIDDDVELCELLTAYLEPEGFAVETVHDGGTGIERALAEPRALIVLDIMLPGLNGFEVLRRLRSECATPVLMLTARGDDVDRIVGLEMGADDYLPKPFNPRELVARIRAILRRAQPASRQAAAVGPLQPVVIGDVRLDPGTRLVHRDGERIELTAVEFNLLEILMRHAGTVVSREQLMKLVLSRNLSPYDRSIDVHVSSIRRKLGRHYGETDRIKAVRGVGYLFTLAPEAGGRRTV